MHRRIAYSRQIVQANAHTEPLEPIQALASMIGSTKHAKSLPLLVVLWCSHGLPLGISKLYDWFAAAAGLLLLGGHGRYMPLGGHGSTINILVVQ